MVTARASKYALLAACCLAAGAGPASAEVFRCTAPDGSVSYQQLPCPAKESSRALDIPSSFPAPDVQERARLFEREAALDRRLEAWRERVSREEIARAMQPPAPPAAQPEESPLLWGLPFPIYGRPGPPRPGMGRPRPTPHAGVRGY
ncbi:MAG TPA: DUF4124 domain-containing protein [Usitatibacter sp.]|nr:DUF4124 domain-containing protein [Usitatibacter sp.]